MSINIYLGKIYIGEAKDLLFVKAFWYEL